MFTFLAACIVFAHVLAHDFHIIFTFVDFLGNGTSPYTSDYKTNPSSDLAGSGPYVWRGPRAQARE